MNIPPNAKTPRNTVYNYILYTVKSNFYILKQLQEVTYNIRSFISIRYKTLSWINNSFILLYFSQIRKTI